MVLPQFLRRLVASRRRLTDVIMAMTMSTIFRSTPPPPPPTRSTRTFPNFSTRCRSTKTAISTTRSRDDVDFLIRSLHPDSGFAPSPFPELRRKTASSRSWPAPEKDRPARPSFPGSLIRKTQHHQLILVSNLSFGRNHIKNITSRY